MKTKATIPNVFNADSVILTDELSDDWAGPYARALISSTGRLMRVDLVQPEKIGNGIVFPNQTMILNRFEEVEQLHKFLGSVKREVAKLRKAVDRQKPLFTPPDNDPENMEQ